jgi:CrcB protein
VASGGSGFWESKGHAGARQRAVDGLPIDPDLLPDDPGEPSATHRPTQHVRRRRQRSVLALVAAGGLVGTAGRYELTLAWPSPAHGFPTATCAINVSGALLIGLVMPFVTARSPSGRRAQALLCTGLLGSWTTMSTFAMQSDLLIRGGTAGVAVGYMAVTMVCGIVATFGGLQLGRALSATRTR